MSDPDQSVLFRRAGSGFSRKALRKFACRLREEVTGGQEFICLITDDRELARLNKQFLGKEGPTDVLSFPEPGPDRFLGEIAISADRAREQAKSLGHGVEQEIQILMLHGVLHLLGMDHERDRGQMARRERSLRRQMGLPVGLIERASKSR